jgi:hypothetical protein
MRAIAVFGVLVGIFSFAGCATPQQWGDWRAHPSHFASGDHLLFSVRNRDGAQTRVTRADVEHARSEAWWGKAITVDQSAIVEN